MSKGLAKAAMVVGAIALVATGVGSAAGASLFGLSQAAAATVGTIATVSTIASAALSVGAALTARKPNAPAAGAVTQFRSAPCPLPT